MAVAHLSFHGCYSDFAVGEVDKVNRYTTALFPSFYSDGEWESASL